MKHTKVVAMESLNSVAITANAAVRNALFPNASMILTANERPMKPSVLIILSKTLRTRHRYCATFNLFVFNEKN